MGDLQQAEQVDRPLDTLDRRAERRRDIHALRVARERRHVRAQLGVPGPTPCPGVRGRYVLGRIPFAQRRGRLWWPRIAHALPQVPDVGHWQAAERLDGLAAA